MQSHYSPQGRQQISGFVKIIVAPPTTLNQPVTVGYVYPVLKVLKDGTSVGNLLTMVAVFTQCYGGYREVCLRTTNPDGTSDYGGYQYQFVREDGTPLPIERQYRPWWRRIFG